LGPVRAGPEPHALNSFQFRVVFSQTSADEATDVDEEAVVGDVSAGELLDDVVLEAEAVANIEMGDEERTAIYAAAQYVTRYSDEVLAEADMEGDELSPVAGIKKRADTALDRLLTSHADEHVDAISALAGDDATEVEGVEDKQGPDGFRKYDEDVVSGVSEKTRAEIASYKLTKTELANLVPEDWDTINVDWFSSKREENIPLPEYKLSFVWTERNIAVAVDQVYSRGQVSPLTEFFFWPRKDAWEELRLALEARPWISERDKVILLNRTTEVINFWQQDSETKPTLEEVKAEFPDCAFMGTSTPAPAPATA